MTSDAKQYAKNTIEIADAFLCLKSSTLAQRQRAMHLKSEALGILNDPTNLQP
jgi:hypothetical protein